MSKKDSVWTAIEQLKLVFSVVVLFVIVVTLMDAFNAMADCDNKGGKLLRGTGMWDSFKCYDPSTLKVL